MSKTIKLEDQVYDRLERIRAKKETFSEAVERLLDIHDKLGLLTSIVQGGKDYQVSLDEMSKTPAASQ